MSDLSDRLRERADNQEGVTVRGLLREAADRLDALEAERDRLRAALIEARSDVAWLLSQGFDSGDFTTVDYEHVNVIRQRASAALTETP